jgi:hypothetical protein
MPAVSMTARQSALLLAGCLALAIAVAAAAIGRGRLVRVIAPAFVSMLDDLGSTDHPRSPRTFAECEALLERVKALCAQVR